MASGCTPSSRARCAIGRQGCSERHSRTARSCNSTGYLRGATIEAPSFGPSGPGSEASEKAGETQLPAVLHPACDRVGFTGWLPPEAIQELYRLADILVVPSWYEPFGMVVLEGMVHGMAIAASRVGGLAEILEHERTGLLFQPRDVPALTQSILRLVNDPDLRLRLGHAASKEVRCTWLWPSAMTGMHRIYAEAASTPNRLPGPVRRLMPATGRG